MTYNTSQQAYGVGVGTTPTNYSHLDTRDPTSNDTPYPIGHIWINTSGQTYWYLNNFTSTGGYIQANWILLEAIAPLEPRLEGDSGGPVSPNGSGITFLTGTDGISITGDPGSNTLTWSFSGEMASSYVTDSGTATPSAGVLNVSGGTGVNTEGSGNTVTINADGSVPLQFTTDDTNHAIPSANNLNIFGGSGINTTSNLHTVTIAVNNSVVGETITGNTGGALSPTAGNWDIVGGIGCSTAGSGSSLAISVTGAVGQTITGDTGGPLSPSSGNWDIKGGTNCSTSGSGSTLTINFSNSSGFINRVNNQVFTYTGSPQTYTPTSGMVYCSIQCVGGGAAGGGAPTTSNIECAAGGGGGGGEYAVGIFSAASIGASQTVTIGAGGAGAVNMNGGNGGTTSVGTLITSFGGQGGNVGVAETFCLALDGGLGGTGGAGGDYRTPGAPGGVGFVALISTGYISVGGQGASGQLSAGGIPQVGAGLPGSGYGAGGAGSSNIPMTVSATAGGNGSAGIVVITEYIA